jgi:shikimate dehydrogenase
MSRKLSMDVGKAVRRRMSGQLAEPLSRSALRELDVVALPPDTPLIRYARTAGKAVITGAEVIALQAAEQFALYTGVRPTEEQIRRASEYARS